MNFIHLDCNKYNINNNKGEDHCKKNDIVIRETERWR